MYNPCAEIKIYPRHYECNTKENADLAVEAHMHGHMISLNAQGEYYEYAEKKFQEITFSAVRKKAVYTGY